MANEQKTAAIAKFEKQGKKYKIKKNQNSDESIIEIDVASDDNTYDIEQLELDLNKLPKDIGGTSIRWLHNFSVKKGSNYLKGEKYTVTIPGLSNKLKEKSSKLVLLDSSGLHYHDGTVSNDAFELSDGDPAAGLAP